MRFYAIKEEKMSGGLKILGAVLTASLLLAVSASSAAAAPVGFFVAGEKSEEKAKQPQFEAESYAATIKGTNTGVHQFTVQAGTLQCNTAQFAGLISAASAALTITPTFSSCVFAGLPPTVSFNGCDYVFNVSNAGPPYVGTTDIACPAGKQIELNVFASGILKCTIKIPPQTGLGSIGYANSGSGSSRVVGTTLSLTGIKYSQVAGTGIGKCTAGEFTNGTYSGSETLAAEK